MKSIPTHALDQPPVHTVELRGRRDGVLGIPHAHLAIPIRIKSVLVPGPGHELGDPLSAGGADGLVIPPALGRDLGSENAQRDLRTSGSGLADQRPVLLGHDNGAEEPGLLGLVQAPERRGAE